ncbi:MAG: DUF3179 domain-containing protein [Bacteroidota bacterium]|nr:DUF3179 domain-containing protein [Bacteroidota bacterium]
MSRLFLIIGILLLLSTEILRVYFIMPFPGSQQSNSIDLAWNIEKYKWALRIIGFVLIANPAWQLYTGAKKFPKILLTLFVVFYLIIFYFFNFRFEADKMFYQPSVKNISGLKGNSVDSNKLIIGIIINNEARAYPIQIIGYHHQVRDTVGNTPVMITYCTVCRTGRVYSPAVNGKLEKFRLVGMDHFNAMFEDESTKSWWQQATGIAIAGSLKGSRLEEIPSRQSTLTSWLQLYPNSTILQPDTTYKDDYADLANFDKGTVKSHLEKRDSASWKNKSWVVGIKSNGFEKAYDWNDLVKRYFIQDTIASQPILLVLEKDTSSFHVFNRVIGGHTLFFTLNKDLGQMTDSNTLSLWSLNGYCFKGAFKDTQLQMLPAYQEFWHSWKQFHPNTTQYKQ